LFVCLLATSRKNFRTDWHAILKEGWQWDNEQMIILVAIRITVWMQGLFFGFVTTESVQVLLISNVLLETEGLLKVEAVAYTL